MSHSADTESDTEFHFPECQIAYYLYRSLTHMSANSLTPNHGNIWRHGKLDGRAEDTVELNCLSKYIHCSSWTPAQNRLGFSFLSVTIISQCLFLSFTFRYKATLALLFLDKFLWHALLGVYKKANFTPTRLCCTQWHLQEIADCCMSSCINPNCSFFSSSFLEKKKKKPYIFYKDPWNNGGKKEMSLT